MAELVATALWEIGGAALTDAAIFIASNATAINAVALATASSVQADRQRRKAIAKYNAGLEDRLVMTATTSAARSRCYGRVRNVEGVLFKATRGANNEFYTLFIAVAGHQIDGFETVYFGDQVATLDGDGYVQTAPWLRDNKLTRTQSLVLDGAGAGSVTAPGAVVAGTAAAVVPGAGDEPEQPLSASVSGATISVTGGPAGATATVTWQEPSGISKARVRFYDGSPSQDVSTVLAPLFPGLITAGEHRFAGIAGMLVDLEFDPDAYPGGVPQISAVFRGARVLDPRTGLTVWTENPALQARDWALYPYGGACSTGDLVEASFTAAANACDIAQPFTTPSGTITQPLFTAGMVLRLGEDPWAQFDELVEAMAGKRGWAGGQLRVVAGVYRAPVITITESWLGGQDAVQIVPEPPTDEAVNIYRATLADKDQGYVVVQAHELRAEGYITADGRELPREITLGAVTDTVHAQHVCGVLMRDARNGLIVSLPCNLRAYQLELFDVVAVTLPRFGWAAKEFEVVDWQFSLSGGVVLTLKETAPSIYQPDAVFAELDVTPNTALPSPAVVPTIGTLTVTSGTVALTDGSLVTRTRVQWPAVADESVRSNGGVELQYALVTGGLAAGTWVSAPPESGAAVETVITGLKLGFAYAVRARAINALGVRGAWSAQAVHLVLGSRRPRVFRQATEPVDPDLVGADKWFDTDAGSSPYVRLAGAWADVRDGGIATAQTAAAAAQGTANTAASNASTALGRLDDIAADSVLTPGEKPSIVLDRDVIVYEQAGILAQAVNYAVTTEKTSYENAVTALVNHLATLTTPVAWDNLSGNTTIVGTVFRGKFADVYTTRQALLDKISANAKARLGALATLSTVDTAQIQPGASTVVLEGSFGDVSSGSVVYPAIGVDATLIVTLRFSATVTPGGTQPGSLTLNLAKGSAPIANGPDANRVYGVAAGGSFPFEGTWVITRTYTVAAADPAGAIYWAQGFAGVTPGGPSIASRSSTVRVEVIKR